jgi:hypothetical protein
MTAPNPITGSPEQPEPEVDTDAVIDQILADRRARRAGQPDPNDPIDQLRAERRNRRGVRL